MMQGTMQGARRRGRPRTAWMDNIKTWTGLPVEESVRMGRGKGGEEKEGEQKGREEGEGKGREGQDRVTEDMDKWRKYVHGVANHWIEDG